MREIILTDEKNAGDMIKQLRSETNTTMQYLAYKSGVSISAISRYENGARVPNMGTFARLMKAMDADIMIIRK